MSLLLRKTLLLLGLAALTTPSGVEAQLREIVTKNVGASSSGATLELAFADDGEFAISLDDGDVWVDGDVVGSFEPGDELDVAWRALLGQAMALENGALAEALVLWQPPEGGSTQTLDASRAVDEALESALRNTEPQAESPEGSLTISVGEDNSLIQLLVNSMGRLGVLEDALEGLEETFQIHVDEDVVIEEGSVVDGTVVVIGGSLRVEGGVEGDVVIVDGTLDVRNDGYIEGEARIAEARVVRNNGEIRGGVVDVLEDERADESELRDRLRDEIREEIRRDLRNEIRSVARFDDDESFSIMSPIRPVVRGVGGVVEKLIMVFILGLIGAGFLAFAGENMDAIADTARRSPGRAAMVGFAGTFLLVPVWLLGALALIISIIGIPVALAWVPLFPLAAMMAAVLGYITVARNAGEWLADSGVPWTGWIRKSNPVFTLVGGLLGLSAAFVAANLISIAPFLNILSGLLFAAGVIVTIIAAQIGFGAVLLTRAGRRREHYGTYDADAAWAEAMGIDVGEGSGKGSKNEG
jgi:hypothetical protein